MNEFITLQNAIQYNQEQNKLFFIADSLDISALGNKVLEVEDSLIKLLEDNGIEIK